MAQAEKEQIQPKKNPIIWVSIVIIGLIIYIFTATDRQAIKSQATSSQTTSSQTTSSQSAVSSEKMQLEVPPESAEIFENSDGRVNPDGQVNRDSLAHPGMRARELISQMRKQGEPYPFGDMMARASEFANEGSLADAHLMFFFTAREGYIEAMMMMAEMSDPTMFRAENNLLDRADAVQAYKWYRQALDQGFEPARARLDNLQHWARAEADYGNADAQHLLLNFN